MWLAESLWTGQCRTDLKLFVGRMKRSVDMPACGVVERVAINISEFFDAEWLRLGKKRHEKGSFNINQNDPKPLFFLAVLELVEVHHLGILKVHFYFVL